MKSLILTFLLFVFLCMKAESPDTLMSVTNPSDVVITESPQGTRVSVSGGQESILIEYPDGANVKTSRSTSRSIFNIPGFPCGRRSDKCGCGADGWAISSDGLCVGLTDAMGQTGGGGLQWSKSFEINWLSCLNVGYEFSRSRIYLGLGLDWRNYKATAFGRWLQPDGDGGVEWETAPEGAYVRATQLKVFSLQLPLMYTWSIPKTYLKWRMGPILNFNTYASLKGIYDDSDGNRCEYFTKDFDRRHVTVDFFASLSYHSALGVYVRYSPMKVLKDSSPINFTPFSVGFTFLL
ncbi:MAG: outer membrane beta-barrel protein [Muribaculaceae bacterium]|nr:outer membrane beta-barrel protein [Muribaculaceae bacterium]